MRSNSVTASIVMCLVALVAAPAASANLLVNAGFETGDFTGWTTSSGVQGSGLSVINQGHSGKYSALFTSNEEFGTDTMYQVVDVVPLETYLVEFWVLNNGVGDDELHVIWNSQTILSQSPIGTPLEEWTHISLLVVNENTPLARLDFLAEDLAASVLIDDVSITLVPEPGAAVLLALAAPLFFRRRAR